MISVYGRRDVLKSAQGQALSRGVFGMTSEELLLYAFCVDLGRVLFFFFVFLSILCLYKYNNMNAICNEDRIELSFKNRRHGRDSGLFHHKMGRVLCLFFFYFFHRCWWWVIYLFIFKIQACYLCSVCCGVD